jgi:hypothetical protein
MKDVVVFVFVKHAETRQFLADEFLCRVVVIDFPFLFVFLGERNVIIKLKSLPATPIPTATAMAP